jgi:hypothetical protein
MPTKPSGNRQRSRRPPSPSPATAAGKASPEADSQQSDHEESPASSPGSAQAATTSFLGNPGEPFAGRTLGPDADQPGDQAEPLAVPIIGEFGWTPERAASILRGQGALTHAMIGVGETDWEWQPAELDAVASPMANGLNLAFGGALIRYAPYADAIGALFGAAGYVGRSRRERAQALAGQGLAEVAATGIDTAGQPAQPAPVDEARRQGIVDRILHGNSRPEPEPEPDGPGADIDWRLGE